MVAISRIMQEIESLPVEYFQEILDFVGYLKLKKLRDVPETMLLSEKALAENWDTPEEDEAWVNL